jgi:hypothetical protein
MVRHWSSNKLLKSGYSSRCCGADGHTCVLVVFSVCLTGSEPSMPFKHPCTAHAFFLKHLSNHFRGLCGTFPEIYKRFDAHLLFHCLIDKPNAWLQIKGHNKLARPPSCLKFCILTSKICKYYHLPLHKTATTAVNIAAPVPEIMDTTFYTGCPRRNVPDFRRVFLMVKYTDITQNTYVQTWTVTEIMAREKCGFLAGPHTVPVSWRVLSMFVIECGVVLRQCLPIMSCIVLGTLRTTLTCVRVLL